MADRIDQFKVLCEGGLLTNEHHLDMSDRSPGAATLLVNFEPSIYGGYRRMEGYQYFDDTYPAVGDNTAEGKVLGVIYFSNRGIGNPYVIAARKDVGAATYSLWKHIPLVGWSKLTGATGLAMSASGRDVTRVRAEEFDFGNGPEIAFVDGVNQPYVFDGVTVYTLTVGGTGGTGSPGGDQLITAPALVQVFEDHLFFSGGIEASLVCHSAPRDPYDFTVAAGAGQIPAGFFVNQLYPFREDLFIFGTASIKRIEVGSSGDFLLKQVTSNVGCIARDTVQEIGGDLVFLSADGFRPVAGTSRIGDVELETISKPIQGLLLDIIKTQELEDLVSVAVRSKSQYRMFYGADTDTVEASYGILGGLTSRNGSLAWEYGEIKGMRASCASSQYIGTEEIVLHGDFDGNLYRQEQGTTFNGVPIFAVYATPFLDFGDTEIRKTYRKLNTFVRAEGPFNVFLNVRYNWGEGDISVPVGYSGSISGSPTVYGGRSVTFDGENIIYGGSSPVYEQNIQGSGRSVQATFISTEDCKPFSIQGVVWEFSGAGRRD